MLGRAPDAERAPSSWLSRHGHVETYGGTSMSGTALQLRDPFELGAMPLGRPMETTDERVVRASVATMFALARDVEHWPAYLPHYRWVRFHERARDGGGGVEMAAWRPFRVVGWPAWCLSQRAVEVVRPASRFRHTEGITAGMDVEWTFRPEVGGTRARSVHAWNGPSWPLIG